MSRISRNRGISFLDDILFTVLFIVTLSVIGFFLYKAAIHMYNYNKPKFSIDSCFAEDYTISQIYDIKDGYYYINLVSLNIEQKRRYLFHIFELEVESKGLIPESCDIYKPKDKQ